MKEHRYEITSTWTGNLGSGTSSYRAYTRDHEIKGAEKLCAIPGSADPAFRGDKQRYNPEDLLVSALSTCHMLSFLHVCVNAGVVVTAYVDRASGTMRETEDGGGHFIEVTLHPVVTITDGARAGEMDALHHKAAELCFIARSVNFPVRHEASVVVEN